MVLLVEVVPQLSAMEPVVIRPSITPIDTPINEVNGDCNVPDTVKLPLSTKLVKVPKLVRLELVKVDGKIVSFLVKNCGIETPITVPTLPSTTLLETDNREVNGLCKAPEIVKLYSCNNNPLLSQVVN